MNRPPARRWLQRELLRRLMLPVLGIVLLSGALSAYGAHSLVEEVFDRWLLDAARSLAAQIRFEGSRALVELTPQSEAMLVYDITDHVSYEVRQGSRHVLGQPGLPGTGGNVREYRGGATAYDGMLAGSEVRVGQVPVPGPQGAIATVIVTETKTKRDRAARALILVFAPVAALVVAAALTVGIAVRRTIRPLERMASFWNEHSHASIQPMPTHDVPRELMPFAVALNDLLARVRELLLRERHLAATAAHQLRTPLAGLQLGLARAAQCPDLASTRAALAELEITTQRTARTLQQLLALSRLDTEVRDAAELQDVDLVTLARGVGEAYMDAAQARGIELELDAARDRVSVRGQPELLGEALANLIDNAIRYIPERGRVLIRVSENPATVAVSDSGPGVPAGEEGKVFDRFVRVRGTPGTGSGLGLAIVKEIALLHGAEVRLDRAPDLGGARFAISFPAAKPKAA